MISFELDPRLQNDCFILNESERFFILLMNNSLVPWFILVPKTDKTELYELDKDTQAAIQDKINLLSEFIKQEYQVDKLNIAAIGNIVQQMHVHIIGRYKSDIYWPGVVWGGSEKETYDKKNVEQIKMKLKSILEL